MSFIVIDTETTGMDPEQDRVVEIAGVADSGAFAHSLANPDGVPISYGAMAVHHITEAMVQDAPTLTQAIAEVGLDMLHHETVLVFHNAAFDRGFLPKHLQEQPWVCTYRCALHLVPDAESHSNGSLWYQLDLAREMPPEAGQMPHRALFDALMTADLMAWMIAKVWADKGDADTPLDLPRVLKHMRKLSVAPVLLSTCKFGKHRDVAWADIPSDYMRWILKQDFDADVKHTCQHWLEQRGHG